MENKRYWRDRAIEREQHWYDLTTQALNEEVKLYYQHSLEKIQRDIASLYARFGAENKLSPAEARRLIRGDEFKVWRKTLEEYVQAAKNDSAILKELNTLAMRSRISRFESLHARTLMEIADLCEKLNQFEDSFQYRAYLANYYGTLYDIHRQYGLSTPPVAVDKNQAEKVIRTDWSGANYSSRIWKNGEKLGREIKQVMLTAVHRGTSIQKLSKDLSRRMEVGYNNAERLVRTELNYIQNRAALDSIASSGLEYYQFIAALDHRTCPRCGGLDGQIFALEEAMQGENYPPLHPRCRCTVSAALGEDLPIKRGKRIAERREKLDGYVTYKDWLGRYIEKTSDVVNGESAGRSINFTRRQLEIRIAEEKAFRAETGADFGFKKFRGNADWSKELMLVNDPSVGLERQMNCQRCVVAFEARMRGFDVMARPSWGANDTLRTAGEWLKAFKYSETDIKRASGKTVAEMIKSVEEIMKSFDEGSRAVIFFQWDKTKTNFEDGHVIIAECRANGVVNFGDPQVGTRTAKNKLKLALSGTIGILRVNDLDFTDIIKRCCMNRSEVV